MIRLGHATAWLIAACLALLAAGAAQLGFMISGLMDDRGRLSELESRTAAVMQEAPVSRDQLRTRLAEMRARLGESGGPNSQKTEAQIVSSLREQIRHLGPGEIHEESFRANGVVRVSDQTWLQLALVLRLPPEKVADVVWAVERNGEGRIVDTVRVTGRAVQPVGGPPRKWVQLTLNIRTPFRVMSTAGVQP